MAKIKYSSRTAIQRFLRGCGFDPRNETEMQAISLISQPDYLEIRAQELISEAQLAGETAHHDQCIIKAIQLLALAHTLRP